MAGLLSKMTPGLSKAYAGSILKVCLILSVLVYDVIPGLRIVFCVTQIQRRQDFHVVKRRRVGRTSVFPLFKDITLYYKSLSSRGMLRMRLSVVVVCTHKGSGLYIHSLGTISRASELYLVGCAHTCLHRHPRRIDGY